MTDIDRPMSPAQPLGIDSDHSLQVELYVRPDISTISHRQVDAIQHRLRILTETPVIDEVDRTRWPRAQVTDSGTGSDDLTRQCIVAEFEAWADDHGVSLRPAFRRQPVPSSLTESSESEEKIRVPIATVALYEASDLAGVVPYTTNYGTDTANTVTVNDWLCAVEDRVDGVATQSVPRREEQDSTA